MPKDPQAPAETVAPTPPPVVPSRNDMLPSGLYKNSKASELRGQNPDFCYENFSTDPESPAYIGKRLVAHERGSPLSGYVMVGPWEVCHSQTDAKVRAMDPRDDQGKPIDTVMRYGRQVTCRIPKTEHAKYALVERSALSKFEEQIQSPDRMRAPGVSMTSVVSSDVNADHLELLRAAGHPMAGR